MRTKKVRSGEYYQLVESRRMDVAITASKPQRAATSRPSSLRQAQSSAAGPSVGVRSIRRLEEAGIRSLEDLKTIETEDLVQLGLRREFANQIRAYVSEVGHRLPRL